MTLRANSRRTGGPRTEEGKQIAAKNSTKLGIYSNQIILPGEDDEEFVALEALFVADFQPQGVAESALVHDLAVLTWKKARLERIERSVLLTEWDRPIGEADLAAIGFETTHDLKNLLGVLKTLTPEQAKRDQETIHLVQKMERQVQGVDNMTTLKDDNPQFYELLVIFIERTLGSSLHFDRIFGHSGAMPKGCDQTPFQKLCEFQVNFYQARIWAFEHKAEIESAMTKVREGRLHRLLNLAENSRAADELNRAYFRTLSEIRKLREWRFKQHIIDITPSHPNADVRKTD